MRSGHIACARPFTATTVRPSSSAMSKSEALEITNSRSRSSSSEVQALQLFILLVVISSGHARFRALDATGYLSLLQLWHRAYSRWAVGSLTEAILLDELNL